MHICRIIILLMFQYVIETTINHYILGLQHAALLYNLAGRYPSGFAEVRIIYYAVIMLSIL